MIAVKAELSRPLEKTNAGGEIEDKELQNHLCFAGAFM